jgi:hypothetical protein
VLGHCDATQLHSLTHSRDGGRGRGSCHTMSTVGYGSVYPISDYCNTIMLFQSYVNIALLAVITSAVFVNFSRPK